MIWASQEATREAISSSQGIVVCRSDATLTFAATRRTSGLRLLATEDKPQFQHSYR